MWKLLYLFVLCALFLNQCVHVECMTGVACFPTLGSPDWVKPIAKSLEEKKQARQYREGLNDLQKAVLTGYLGAVDDALRQHPEQRDALTSEQESILTLAVSGAPNVEIIKRLLAVGAEAFKPPNGDSLYGTPFATVLRRNEKIVLNAFLNPAYFDPQSSIASDYLTQAVSTESSFPILWDLGVRPKNRYKLLKEIASRGAANSLALALKAGPLAQDIGKDRLYHLLSAAVSACKFDIAETLVAEGATMVSKDPESKGLLSSLLEACNSRSLEYMYVPPGTATLDERIRLRNRFLRDMVANGINLNVEVKECPAWLRIGWHCSLSEDLELVRQLLALGADPYVQYPRQELPAVAMAWQGPRTLMLDMLAKRPSSKDHRALNLAFNALFDGPGSSSSFLMTADQLAAERQLRFTIATKLLAYGADINAMDNRGYLSLHNVILRSNYAEDGQFLLDHGANVNAFDDRGETALYQTLDNGDPRMKKVLWLARHGADLSLVTEREVRPKSLQGREATNIIAKINAAAVSTLE